MKTTYNNGNMILADDRNTHQQTTHTHLITATDRCFSGWGMASGGLSKCAWACRPCDFDKILAWVESRRDMKYVNCNFSGKWRPSNAAHVHIYVVTDSHPALQ